ncbi:MAG TPA: hypothetical protein VK206_04720, partial [Anaerolineales bacterium]|nr:hypothetical protein [Anaerolineales bacterium]
AEGVDYIPVVHPDDVAGYALEIKKFRETPASERVAVGQKCRRIVEERFSLFAMHAGYENVYDEVLGTQRPSFFDSVSVERE